MKDAFEILGISPGASMREARKAFAERIKETHPDHNQGADQGERERLKARTAELNAAYEQVKKNVGGSTAPLLPENFNYVAHPEYSHSVAFPLGMVRLQDGKVQFLMSEHYEIHNIKTGETYNQEGHLRIGDTHYTIRNLEDNVERSREARACGGKFGYMADRLEAYALALGQCRMYLDGYEKHGNIAFFETLDARGSHLCDAKGQLISSRPVRGHGSHHWAVAASAIRGTNVIAL